MDPNHARERGDLGDSSVFGTWTQRDTYDVTNLHAVGHLNRETQRTDVHSLSHFGFHAHVRIVGRSTALPTFWRSTVETGRGGSKGTGERVSMHCGR